MSKNIDDKITYAKDLRPSTAKKVDSIIDMISEIAKAEYERGKEDEERWWSGFYANRTDEDRPQGEWIEVDDYCIRCKCSICGWESHKYEDDVYGMPYCPNCGAKMKGVSDETAIS